MEEEEEDEEEQVLFLNCVVYSQQAVVNSYILEYLSQHGNTAASNMLLDLPCCCLDSRKSPG